MTNRNIRIFMLTVLLAALAGCGTTKVVETWESDAISPEAPKELAVLVVWPDQLQRLVIERDMVAAMRKKGINAVESSEVHGMRGELTAQSAEIALRNANIDALVMVFIIGGGGGATYERNDYWMQYVGSAMYGWYAPYYADVYTVREGPGYAEKTTEIFLETTYVDVRKIDRVWSMVTKSDDIEYQDVALRLTDRIMTQMRRSGQM